MKTNKTNIMFVAFALFAVLLVPSALAEPTGANVTIGPSERGTATTAETVDTEGGNVTEVNVSGTSITGRWAGFWGTVEGGIALTDAADNAFFEWTVSNVTGAVVYAASAAVTDFSTLTAGNDTVAPAYVQADVTDNYNNTFNVTDTFTSASLNIAGAPFVTTLGGAGALRTYSLADGTTHIWAAEAVQDSTGFNTETVDYQLLAPANSAGITYTFYLELP